MRAVFSSWTSFCTGIGLVFQYLEKMRVHTQLLITDVMCNVRHKSIKRVYETQESVIIGADAKSSYVNVLRKGTPQHDSRPDSSRRVRLDTLLLSTLP